RGANTSWGGRVAAPRAVGAAPLRGGGATHANTSWVEGWPRHARKHVLGGVVAAPRAVGAPRTQARPGWRGGRTTARRGGAARRGGGSAPVKNAPAGLAQRQGFVSGRRRRGGQRDEAPLADAFAHHRHASAIAPLCPLVVIQPATIDSGE